ncbi:SDR family NAD(P)-dependent oxidoreductase [Anaerosacchariphilus polymeriproducens]|uniref:SDR family NAD(P)-dependent oxidoreductase n=1 Tax=Anaerosacchariphilus polymeriproducens TaxID=1812858 RepID=A0A371AWL2_9FIRM|nr:SDR family NAD(P)-dependent oxidoreductase [Anaerosacchariphilus polymeriproducens]RDU23929.1 SDR family NAD(P)-dependent oxidoreductase [Anaerosacchariphilus polymeriproducens]
MLKALDRTKKYLVTGAAGFIGYYLSKRLLEEGCCVIGYDNLNDYYEVSLKETRLDLLKNYDKFTFYKGDLADKDYLENVFQQEKIQVVVNLAAQAGVRYSLENPDAYIQSNLVGFANILEMCRNYKIEHLLFASSSSVYGNSDKIPFSVEDKTDQPVSLYAATKKANELLAYSYSHLYSIPATGLRFFTVYGPMGRPDMAYFLFTKAISEDKSIKVFNNGDLYRDFTYVDDIIDGIVRLIENSIVLKQETKPPFKVYNIGNNQPEKLMDFIKYLEECLGKEAKKEFYPMQPGDVYRTFADVSDLEKDVEFKPNTSLKAGLRYFVDWYKEYYSI